MKAADIIRIEEALSLLESIPCSERKEDEYFEEVYLKVLHFYQELLFNSCLIADIDEYIVAKEQHKDAVEKVRLPLLATIDKLLAIYQANKEEYPKQAHLYFRKAECLSFFEWASPSDALTYYKKQESLTQNSLFMRSDMQNSLRIQRVM